MKTPSLSPLVPGPPGPGKKRVGGRQRLDQCPLSPPSQCYFKHHFLSGPHALGLTCKHPGVISLLTSTAGPQVTLFHSMLSYYKVDEMM